MSRVLGVLRETQNSPNRVTDDARILESVLAELRSAGVGADLMSPEEFDSADLSAWDLLVPMCESYPRLMRLAGPGAADRAIPRGSVTEPWGEEMPLPISVEERPASEGRRGAADRAIPRNHPAPPTENSPPRGGRIPDALPRGEGVGSIGGGPARLRAASEGRRGAAAVNPPEAVLNCYRVRMAPILGRTPEALFPPTEVRPVDAGRPPPGFEAPEGWWIKRGDVHNTCDHDVVRVMDWSRLDLVLQDFLSREITHMLVQPHIPGDLVKFYGVGPGRWFTWFYHDPASARRIPFEAGRLAQAVAAGAAALKLEVFGGDAIVSEGGGLSLIDLNSWPSFARVRPEAAGRIAEHLLARLRVREARRPRRAARRRRFP